MAVAAVTRRIRVGPGGVLLRFRSPLAIANSARLLDFMFPGRIDLGLAGGTVLEPELSAFLDGRPDYTSSDDHARKLVRTLSHLRNTSAEKAIPGARAAPITWFLDSTGRSADLAAANGAAYALSLFHTESRPHAEAVARYREAFVPTAELPQPAVVVAVALHCTVAGMATPRFGAPVFQPLTGSPEQCCAALGAIVEAYDVDEVVVLDLSADQKHGEIVLEQLASLCDLDTPEAFGVGPGDGYLPTEGDPVFKSERAALDYLETTISTEASARSRVHGLCLPNGWRADVAAAPDGRGLRRHVATARTAHR